MTMAITFNDINISKWIDGILLVTRNVGQNRVPQLDQVGRSDGKMFSYIRADEGTITVTAIVRTDVNKKRRLLADALTTSTPTKLIFADEPDIYYNAISTGQITLDEAYLHNTLTITFTVPDGIAHSVATQTFDNMPYKDMPVNLLTGTSTPVQITGNGTANNVFFPPYTFGGKQFKDIIGTGTIMVLSFDWSVSDQGALGSFLPQLNAAPWYLGGPISISSGSGHYYASYSIVSSAHVSTADGIQIRMDNVTTTITISNMKFEINTAASPWSPNPADPEYYSDTITVHNGGTYPVEPVITATMHADNGMVGIVNDRPGILQFGTQEIDGFTTEESEVALNLAAVQGSHMDNQAATNNPYWGGDPSMPNEQIGNAIWTHDDYDGWKVEPNWPSITGDHKYWNGPSIKHNLVQTHNGNFKSNLTWTL